MASEVIFTQFIVTRDLHTARISNAKSTMCDNKERKMAILSSERNEKDGIFSCHERGTKKKSETPMGIKPVTSCTPGECSNH